MEISTNIKEQKIKLIYYIGYDLAKSVYTFFS